MWQCIKSVWWAIPDHIIRRSAGRRNRVRLPLKLPWENYNFFHFFFWQDVLQRNTKDMDFYSQSLNPVRCDAVLYEISLSHFCKFHEKQKKLNIPELRLGRYIGDGRLEKLTNKMLVSVSMLIWTHTSRRHNGIWSSQHGLPSLVRKC